MTRSLFVSDILPMDTTFSVGTPKFSQSGFLQVLTWISWTGGGTRGRSVRRGALLPRFGFLSSEEDLCFPTTSPEPLDSGAYRSEASLVWQECVITFRSRCAPD